MDWKTYTTWLETSNFDKWSIGICNSNYKHIASGNLQNLRIRFKESTFL